MYDLLGWTGNILFSLCAVPQAWLCYKQGHSRGIAAGLLAMWFWGELLTFAYVWPKQDWPLLCNYMANFLCLLVIIRYKLWEREDDESKVRPAV